MDLSNRSDYVIREKSSLIARSIIEQVFPDGDTELCGIVIDEFLLSSTPNMSTKVRKFGFASPEIMVVGELVIPLVCCLVIDVVREYYRTHKLKKDPDLEKEAYLAALDIGMDQEKAKVLSKEFVKAFKLHI